MPLRRYIRNCLDAMVWQFGTFAARKTMKLVFCIEMTWDKLSKAKLPAIPHKQKKNKKRSNNKRYANHLRGSICCPEKKGKKFAASVARPMRALEQTTPMASNLAVRAKGEWGCCFRSLFRWRRNIDCQESPKKKQSLLILWNWPDYKDDIKHIQLVIQKKRLGENARWIVEKPPSMKEDRSGGRGNHLTNIPLVDFISPFFWKEVHAVATLTHQNWPKTSL